MIHAMTEFYAKLIWNNNNVYKTAYDLDFCEKAIICSMYIVLNDTFCYTCIFCEPIHA